MEKALKKVGGVDEVTVSFDDKRAEVTASGSACEPAGLSAMVKEVQAAGYGAEVTRVDRDLAGG